MANQGKHKKNPIIEWIEEEDSTVPTKSRSAHVVDSYIKKSKVALKKARPAAVPQPASAAPDPALMREEAPPPKLEEKHSQAASWEHLKKLERLPQLRAPYQYKSR